jgi:hypothetical protein
VEAATLLWQGHQLNFAEVARPLRLVSQGARDLAAMLARLDKNAKRALVVCLARPDDDDEEHAVRLQDCEFVLSILDTAAADASRIGGDRRKPGRPRGSPNYPLSLLVGRLYTAIEEGGGRRPTYIRNRQSGTLVWLLEQLRPHVPDGLMPDPLPYRSLEDFIPRKTPE